MNFNEKILLDESFDLNQNFSYKKGNKKIIITSVHSMIQKSGSGIKKREPFTKAIAKYVSEESDCFNYIKLKDTGIDSNSIEIDEFKENLLNIIIKNDIKLLIDIHGANENRNFDVEFGTLNNLTINFFKLEKLKNSFIVNGINEIKENEPFLGGGITRYIYENTYIDVVQIEINSKFRDYNNLGNIKKICDSLIHFINSENYI